MPDIEALIRYYVNWFDEEYGDELSLREKVSMAIEIGHIQSRYDASEAIVSALKYPSSLTVAEAIDKVAIALDRVADSLTIE